MTPVKFEVSSLYSNVPQVQLCSTFQNRLRTVQNQILHNFVLLLFNFRRLAMKFIFIFCLKHVSFEHNSVVRLLLFTLD